MMIVRALLLVGLFFVQTCDGQDETNGTAPPAGIEVVEAFPALRFSSPVDIQHAGDGSDRLFIVEQRGTIAVFGNHPDATQSATFLDLRDRVRSGGEEGLLGLAFHPRYTDNGFFFLYYSAPNPRRSVVARFSVDPDDAGRADAASEQVLLEVPQPFSNHNGGQLAFGPDGYLYIALGDGGSGGDPRNHGQNRRTLLGSILRIDVDAPSGGRNYGIPADNPFVGNTEGFREEIYAYGLRNPWRMCFDPATGDLWTGDVGQNRIEEIDVIEKGGNYGWNTMEGSRCFEPSSGCDTDGLILPVAEYPHSEGNSVTGGCVYRGAAVPALAGRYVYADFGSGRLWTLDANAPATGATELLRLRDLRIPTFGTDEQGELYFSAFDGKIYRFAQK